MKSIDYYISALKEQKTELAQTLNEKGIASHYNESLERLIDKTQNLGLGEDKPISFRSNKSSITLGIRGSGSINIYGNETLLCNVTLSDNEEIIKEISDIDTNITHFWFDTLKGITSLDLSNNEITSISFVGDNELNKLVLYGNNITHLNCSSCKELQFLHIFDNPLCDEEEYELNLESTFNSLISRTNKAMGSIVFYPWYGLEKLICKDSNNDWIKFPNNHVALAFENDRLYGVVEGNSITYYTYTNNELVEHSAMNRHHSLRKSYESNITLAKNWLFGSAIQYSEDYQYCYYHFRQSGVQDMWETAEKGFGMCIGSIDQYTGTNPEWADMNVRGYYTNNDTKIYTESHPNYKAKPENRKQYRGFMAGDWQHGDFILSQLAGRGGPISYGLCPNAQVYLVDVWEGSGWIGTNKIIYYLKEKILKECNTYSSSYINGYSSSEKKDFQEIRYLFGEFGKTNVLTLSAGNDNAGLPWTYAPNNYMHMYGNYGSENNLSSLENHSSTFFIQALTPNKQASAYSSNSMGANDKEYGTGFTKEDYLACYGDQILGYENNTGNIMIKQGTSMASPNCNGILALMRIIYSKISPSCSSFGKGSEFMEYVKNYWMDPIENNMTFAVGMGMPYIFATPQGKRKNLTKFNGALPSSVEYCVGSSFEVVDSIPKDCKKGVSYDFDPYYIVQWDEKTFIPVREGQNVQVDIYSNENQNNWDEELNGNFFKSSIFIDAITPLDFTLIEDAISGLETAVPEIGTGKYIIPNVQQPQSEEIFTVQFVAKCDMATLASDFTGTSGAIRTGSLLAFLKRGEKIPLELMFTGFEAGMVNGVVSPIIKDKMKLAFGYFDTNTLPNDYRGYCYNYCSRFKIKTNDIFVLTFVFEQDHIKCYYNGTLIMYIKSSEYKYNLSDIYINSTATIHGAKDVVFYTRALSQEEVINNSIALIQKEEKQ